MRVTRQPVKGTQPPFRIIALEFIVQLHVNAKTEYHKLRELPSWTDESIAFHTFQNVSNQIVGNLCIYSAVKKHLSGSLSESNIVEL